MDFIVQYVGKTKEKLRAQQGVEENGEKLK